MDLRFQPENIFCKPVYGDLCSTSGVLVKIRVRRRKGAASNANDNATRTDVIVLGAVNSIVKFECKFVVRIIAKCLWPNTQQISNVFL